MPNQKVLVKRFMTGEIAELQRPATMSDVASKNVQLYNEVVDIADDIRNDSLSAEVEYKELKKDIRFLQNRVDLLETRVAELESKLELATPEPGTFLRNITNKIEILKNKIKKDLPEGDLFSINLTDVESIEEEVLINKKVTPKQLSKLNDIYSRVNKQ